MYYTVSFLHIPIVLYPLFPILILNMEALRIGSLNINGGRDSVKRAIVYETIEHKKLDIVFLQETHSGLMNEIEWNLWWKGYKLLSHGTNLSRGVGIFFSSTIRVDIISTEEPVKGRLLVVKAQIQGLLVFLINIYAPTVGQERILFFYLLNETLKKCSSEGCVVIDGDWNCTINLTIDRNTEEPHIQSSSALSNLIKEFQLLDMWRIKHPYDRQYTWIKTFNRVTAARLDRFYVSKYFNSRVIECCICPVGFSDHHLIIMKMTMSNAPRKSAYWHFNVKLLQDTVFCDNFVFFWDNWKKQKSSFENLKQWWDIGKTQIKMFCLQYSVNCSSRIKNVIESLEKQINAMELQMVDAHNSVLHNDLQKKKRELSQVLNEKVKGALIRSRFMSLAEMDAPTTFFNLEYKVAQQKQMPCLKLHDGRITYKTIEMRNHAVNFYSNLYAAESCENYEWTTQLLQGLPQLDCDSKTVLDARITFEEITAAVGQFSSGRSPGIGADFYKRFWNCIGHDYFDVLCESIRDGVLPTTCQYAVLSLLPKKGDLAFFKNWRPVALLTTEYNFFFKMSGK